MSVTEFNSRTQAVRTAPRVRQTTTNRTETTGTAAKTPAETGEPAAAYQWSRYAPVGKAGYECSTQGDRRFSALYAKLSDGRTIEEAYQLDIKGYRVQGNDWRLGKGKPPLQPMPVEALYSQYKGLWQQWADENSVLMDTLATEAKGKVLTDKFASTPISQARALTELLNERQLTTAKISDQATAGLCAPDRITALEPHQVFVFGSNTEGRHGAGAARQAVQFGAEYSNPRGRQGQTYAIVTKDLTKPRDQQLRSVPLDHIESQINEFLSHAIAHPKTEFLVTRFGCALAGYSEAEIGGLWVGKTVPTNVRLPQAFLNVVQAAAQDSQTISLETNEFEQTQTLEQWGVLLLEPTSEPARYLIYADAECCSQSDSVDVQTQTCAFTQKAIQEAQKHGYERIEIIVATLNDDPANLECLQPLVAAAQSGMSKAQIMNEVSDKLSFQAEVYESPDAALDLLDLKGNPDSRLILISNGKGEGTKQMAQQAENISVKVIGYNPEKQEYIGASRPQTAAVKIAAAKGGKDTGR